MGTLTGLKEYLDHHYHISIFDQGMESQEPLAIHLHPHRIIRATITENQVFDVKLLIQEGGKEIVPKVGIKLLYSATLAESIDPLIKMDKKVGQLGLEPILAPNYRHHIKNKTLFPLMKDREVLFFTLLEGEVVRGILSEFSRYELTVTMKGGHPLTILRHSIYDVRNKKGRSFLKEFQEEHRDWEKSPLFVASE
jgi:hypothetical protein